MTPDISLILPAYNEARVIPTTVGEAVRYFDSRKLAYEIIVAADGADGTREIVRKMAIANPAHAPYGRAAISALQSAHIYEQVRAKFVLGENISQAAQFAQSGNAQAGILAYSQAHSPAMRDGKHQHAICLVVDPINDAPIANAVTQMAGEFARHCCAGAARALTCAKQRASFHASGRSAAA